MEITNSSAIVFGAGSGLGLATVRALVDAGARVTAADLDPSVIDDPILRATPGCNFVQADVTDPDMVARAIELASQHGPLRICVNTAGVSSSHRVLSTRGPLPLEDFARVIDVNLLGSINTLRLAAASMSSNDDLEGERGVIVQTASIAAFEGQAGQVAYAASKAGVAGMTISAARDLAPHRVRVVTVAPGLFDTPMMSALPEPVREGLAALPPHPSRLGRPDEFASLVCHIVSNPMLNGETVRLDASLRLPPR